MTGFQIAGTLAKGYNEAKSCTSLTSRTKCREQSRGIIHSFLGGASIRRAAVSRFAARNTRTSADTRSCRPRDGREPLKSPSWGRIVVKLDNTTMNKVTEIVARDSGPTDQADCTANN